MLLIIQESSKIIQSFETGLSSKCKTLKTTPHADIEQQHLKFIDLIKMVRHWVSGTLIKEKALQIANDIRKIEF